MASFTWTLGIKVTPDGLMPCSLNDPGYFIEIEGHADVNGSGVAELYLLRWSDTRRGFIPADSIGGHLYDQIIALLEKHYDSEIGEAVADWKADGPRQKFDHDRKAWAS